MSKFDIYLNTEKPAVVEKLIDVYPFAGVCCNPQMVARLGRTDFANIVKELRAATGSRKLFIQTPSNDYDGIMRDAEAILKIAGNPQSLRSHPLRAASGRCRSSLRMWISVLHRSCLPSRVCVHCSPV